MLVVVGCCWLLLVVVGCFLLLLVVVGCDGPGQTCGEGCKSDNPWGLLGKWEPRAYAEDEWTDAVEISWTYGFHPLD